MSKTLVTADTHFFHGNIIKYCNRPFKDPAEMTEFLIDAWNSKVNKDDTVYHLGDVALGNVENCIALLKRLNGTIHLIKGNHEKTALEADKKIDRFASVKDYKELRIDDRSFVLCHYPLASWNREKYGTIHLHGHCHQTLRPLKKNRIDIGVDHEGFDYAPQTIDEIIALAKLSESLTTTEEHDTDHHTA